jgi:hypothetical protein
VAVLTRIAVCVIALMLTAACRMGQEQWGPFRGQVVDFDTGEPIAGAYVMVMWIRDRPALHSGESFYDAQETRTGADGWFEIPYERRWVTAFVNPPAVNVFVPGYVMDGAAVVTGGGRSYVDPTFIGMRHLVSHEEQCKLEPIGVRADARVHVPHYAAAQDAYKTTLQCGVTNDVHP